MIAKRGVKKAAKKSPAARAAGRSAAPPQGALLDRQLQDAEFAGHYLTESFALGAAQFTTALTNVVRARRNAKLGHSPTIAETIKLLAALRIDVTFTHRSRRGVPASSQRLKPIRTRADLKEALARLDVLLNKDESDTEAMNDLEVLAILVESYEREQHPVEAVAAKKPR
ncbi:MAG: hypothetical protein ACAI38_21660 [Myxococcota bacterium]|nr:hypothetical protein [Myxococcota bacterium]